MDHSSFSGSALKPTAGSIVLFGAGTSIPLVLFGCALFGIGIGNLTSLPALIAQAEFRPADLPRVVALMTAIGQAGYAFAPAVFGLLRELDGLVPSALVFSAAPLLFATAAAFQLAAACMLLSGGKPTPRQASPRSADARCCPAAAAGSHAHRNCASGRG
jgi:MFS family permease